MCVCGTSAAGLHCDLMSRRLIAFSAGPQSVESGTGVWLLHCIVHMHRIPTVDVHCENNPLQVAGIERIFVGVVKVDTSSSHKHKHSINPVVHFQHSKGELEWKLAVWDWITATFSHRVAQP